MSRAARLADFAGWPDLDERRDPALQTRLAEVCQADAVLFGSGLKTCEIASDHGLVAQLQLDPVRQLIGAQCSGTLSDLPRQP